MSNRWPRKRGAGFSLVELLVAVSIMLVIIYALYAMFNQTQKALRANITQVDVMEAGRAAVEMICRELEQVTASNLGQTNIFTRVSPAQPLTQLDLEPSQTNLRTNILHEFFFLSRQGSRWIGTGYVVVGANEGVGTLCRFTTSALRRELARTNLLFQFLNTPVSNTVTRTLSTNFNRVADGIVHLRLTAYDTEGRRLGWDTNYEVPNYRILRLNRGGGRIGLTSTAFNASDAQVILQQATTPFREAQFETRFAFISNALPGYIEVELGVLEPATLKRYESLRESPKAAEAFLERQASKVHLFRQRVPIRTALQ